MTPQSLRELADLIDWDDEFNVEGDGIDTTDLKEAASALRAYATRLESDAGDARNGNYVCDKEVCPTSVTFADGRIVRLAHDADHGYYLEIERAAR